MSLLFHKSSIIYLRCISGCNESSYNNIMILYSAEQILIYDFVVLKNDLKGNREMNEVVKLQYYMKYISMYIFYIQK